MLNIARLAAALMSLIALLPSPAFAQATKAGVVATLAGHGTVVVAEVSSAAAQAGGAVGPTGTLWVLTGQIEAFLANQPGNAVLVSALQQFRGGNVTNILPGQMAPILQGLSTGRLPRTQGGDAQAKENGVNAAIALANSFTG